MIKTLLMISALFLSGCGGESSTDNPAGSGVRYMRADTNTPLTDAELEACIGPGHSQDNPLPDDTPVCVGCLPRVNPNPVDLGNCPTVFKLYYENGTHSVCRYNDETFYYECAQPRRRTATECLDWRRYGYSTFSECTDEDYYDTVEGEDIGIRCAYATEQLTPQPSHSHENFQIYVDLAYRCRNNGGTIECPSETVGMGNMCEDFNTRHPISGEACSYTICREENQ